MSFYLRNHNTGSKRVDTRMMVRDWKKSMRRHVASAAWLLLAVMLTSCSEPEPETGTLIVNTTPEGVSIMVDGTDYGQTPARITGLALGEHYIILMDPNHDRLNHRVSIDTAEPLELDLIMERHSGQLVVSTEPVGAEVILVSEDGEEQLLGITPMPTRRVKTGKYTIQVRMDDFYPIEQELEVENGGAYTFSHHLEAMEARIRVYSRPTEANIYVNDQKRRETTPATLTMAPGEYTIGVHLDGYMVNEKTYEMKPNVTIDFSVELEEGDMPIGMVLVPAGPFPFGEDNKSPDERPRAILELPAFYIDKYEVTNEEFKAVFPGHSFEEGLDDLPVTGITWKQASDYAAAVGKRLPTEQEWEKAARGPQGFEYPWGNAFNGGLVNYQAGVATGNLKRTGSHRKGVSYYGCFDMAGNAYEWVDSWYNPYFGNTDVTIDYGTVYRVLRGGSYLCDEFEVRAAKRHYAKPDLAREDFGFRCAKDAG